LVGRALVKKDKMPSEKCASKGNTSGGDHYHRRRLCLALKSGEAKHQPIGAASTRKILTANKLMILCHRDIVLWGAVANESGKEERREEG